ncbi:hypothetical protein Pyn_20600 [Prunus yedoensis var. nudiflora]|uniref:Uncharacterized protein n=1 Tax=Prunus yedoensis var. nudiflora TaxID=2094558 RepID=A0A314V2I6_PRUYE|nr:hypothetical protein Pyn_20600 [Prunus yedoensis var. nudiflora]
MVSGNGAKVVLDDGETKVANGMEWEWEWFWHFAVKGEKVKGRRVSPYSEGGKQSPYSEGGKQYPGKEILLLPAHHTSTTNESMRFDSNLRPLVYKSMLFFTGLDPP